MASTTPASSRDTVLILLIKIIIIIIIIASFKTERPISEVREEDAGINR